MTLTLEEESCLVSDQIAGKVLRRIHQAGNDCAPTIASLKQVEKARLTTVREFNLSGALHHGECFCVFLVGATAQALDRTKGLLLAAVADEPPRGFGGEEDKNQKWGLCGLALVPARGGKMHSRERATARLEVFAMPTR